MIIILSPVASDHDTSITVEGLVLTVGNAAQDLSVIPEGGQAKAEDDGPFIGLVTRDEVTVKYFYDGSTSESMQSTDWADYTFDIVSGAVPDPIVRKPVEVVE